MMCEIVGSLPNKGGVFDQQRNHVKMLEQIYRARNQWIEDKTPGNSQSTETKKRLDDAQARANREELHLI